MWLSPWLTRMTAAILVAIASSAPVAAQSGSGPWTPALFMLHERSESAIVALDGRMYVIGGYPGDRIPSAVVQIWDSRTETWSEGPPVPMPLHHAAAVAVNGKIYLIGGEVDGAGTGRPSLFLDTVFELDPEVGTWVPRAPLPSPRRASAAVVLDGQIYVAGVRPPAGPEF